MFRGGKVVFGGLGVGLGDRLVFGSLRVFGNAGRDRRRRAGGGAGAGGLRGPGVMVRLGAREAARVASAAVVRVLTEEKEVLRGRTEVPTRRGGGGAGASLGPLVFVARVAAVRALYCESPEGWEVNVAMLGFLAGIGGGPESLCIRRWGLRRGEVVPARDGEVRRDEAAEGGGESCVASKAAVKEGLLAVG